MKKTIYLITFLLIIGAIYYFLIDTDSNKPISAKKLNLLVITLDTIRTDHIGAYGYKNGKTPNIDKLARNGFMFENCYSPVPLTLPAHCSIFTGQYPIGHKVRNNGTFFLNKNVITLAEKIKELPERYQTFAIVSSFVLLSKFGLKQGFDIYDDSLKINEIVKNYDSEISADKVYKKFQYWLNNRKNGFFFSWIHFYDPHSPYSAPEKYQNQFPNDIKGRYDAEIAFTDFYIGKILEDLEKKNLLDNTLILLTGDHGEAFGEHMEFGHSIFCYEENLRVPLILYNPKLFKKGQKSSIRVSLVDIMPTLIELYGLKIPTGIHGKSFAKILSGKNEDNRTILIESMYGKEEMGWAPLTGIIDGSYKYISLPIPELYNLENDKIEKINLFNKEKYRAKKLDKKIIKRINIYSKLTNGGISNTKSKRKLTEKDKKHLQTLGYISTFSGEKNTNLDPKKGILLNESIKKIKKKIKEGKLDNAEIELKKIKNEHPKTLPPQYFGTLDLLYREKGHKNLIFSNWRDAINYFPKNDNFKINLALEYYRINKYSESKKIINNIIKNNDKYTRAFILKAQIMEKEHNLKKAMEFFNKAYLLEPQNNSLALAYAKILTKNKKFKPASDICDKILQNKNTLENTKLKTQLGILLTEIRKDDEALKILTQIESEGNSTAKTLNYIGIIKARQKKYREAEKYYINSISKDPKSALTYNNLGTLYLTGFLKSKNSVFHNKAMNAFNKALYLNPKLVSALNGRASAYKFINKPQQAITDWKKALSIDPEFVSLYFNLAVTYTHLKNNTQALFYLNQCKKKFYSTMPNKIKQRLDRMINRIVNK